MLKLIIGLSILLTGTHVLADTYSDFFGAASYNNQDGSNNWATDWVESNDDGLPASGDIQIITGELRLQNNNVRIARAVDLSGYDVATLTFDYREVGFDDNRDEIRVEVRSGGGWTRLARYRGRNVNNGSASLAIPAVNLAVNTEIRFRSGNRTGSSDRFYIDNVTIDAQMTIPVGDYADFFNVVAYTNQDGTLNWSADWRESGDDGLPASGDIRINAGELRLQNNNRIITRQLDLSGFATATLSFDYREVGYDDNRDETRVEIRSGGGGWTRIVRYRGRNVNNGSASFVLPSANLAANTEIRMRTGKRTGNNDQFFVDNFIVNVTQAVASVPDHFDIMLTSGTFGINCVAHQVKITAHDASHNPFATYVGQIQLATSTGAGDWTDGGLGNNGVLVNGIAGDGIATYQYAIGDNGEADFYLDYSTGASNIVGINVNDTTDVLIVDDSIETIQFAPTGFTLTQNPLSNPPPNPINDPVTTQVAGTGFNVSLAAYGQTPTDANCGIIEAYTGNHELHFWVTYNDPATGTVTPTIDAQSALNQECSVPGPPDCNLAANKQTVTFTNGQASITAKYKDTGRIAINVKDDDFQATNAHTIPGATGPFVVQPAEFAITTIETGAAVANPGTTSAGSGFVAADEAYHVVVEVRDAEGSLVPNYGNETVPESVRLLLANLVYPAGGNLGSLTNATGFAPTATNGEFENSTVSWNEVGTVTLRAGIGDGDYLGSGDVTGAMTGNVGRFYPGDFNLASATVTNSCAAGSFSYMSHTAISVNYSLQARGLNGGIVTNYDNTTLGYTIALPSYHAENNNDGTDLAARLSIASGQWNNGILTIADLNSSFNRAGSPDGPFSNLQLGLQITDPDGADFSLLDFKPAASNNCVVDGDCVGVAIGATLNTRFGRMHLLDAFGPELAAIPMAWQTEYWDGASFIDNTDDHCTQLAISDVSFTGASSTVDAAADTITVTIGGISSIFDFADPNGASDCLTALNIGFCDGRAGIQYGAPGTVISYPISVDLTNLPYLRFDWDQDGNYNDVSHPVVNVNFQSYRGHDRVINWQEILR